MAKSILTFETWQKTFALLKQVLESGRVDATITQPEYDVVNSSGYPTRKEYAVHVYGAYQSNGIVKAKVTLKTKEYQHVFFGSKRGERASWTFEVEKTEQAYRAWLDSGCMDIYEKMERS